MSLEVRTRFAPSPTGSLHIGGFRTALYNYLFAKQNNGSFIVRLEDTDRTRLKEGVKEKILDVLQWCEISPDESWEKPGAYGPYIQSQRKNLYREYCHKLIKEGKAYYCFSTSEELEESRKLQQKQGLQPKYNRKWLPEPMGGHMPQSRIIKKLENGDSYVVRMKVPNHSKIGFQDQVRGYIEFDASVIDDQVLLKSDGFPTYHLAVVVDDHAMKISHIIRGEEWLSSTPKHVLLYDFFGWNPPQFVHVPLLLNSNRAKLSKREGDVSVEAYRKEGYSPESLISFVALLGWNEGSGTEKEIYSMVELLEKFSLDRIGRSGAVFNVEKLSWIEKIRIRNATNRELAQKVQPLLIEELKDRSPSTDINNITRIEYIEKVVSQMKERVNFISEFVTFSSYYFFDPLSYDEKGVKKRWKDGTSKLIRDFVAILKDLKCFNADEIEKALRNIVEKNSVSVSDLVHPVRIAISGTTFGPGLYEMMDVIGKMTCVQRLERANQVLPKR